MKRPVTSLCRRPGKKTARRQSVPGAGTISAHRDALRRAVRSAGQKPPGRGRKNSPGRGVGDCAQTAPMGERRTMGGVWCREGTALGARRGRGHAQAQKQPPAEAGSCAQAAPMGERRAMGGVWCREASHWAPAGTGVRPGAKTASGGAGGCLDAGYGCYLPRAIRVIWMHRVGSTARPRIMPS